MKKALKINLSGQIFHIDEDAYDKLKFYLDTISTHFSSESESREVMADIEGRIRELFNERLHDESQVVTIKEVNEVIDIMGRPEEIITDSDEETGKRGRFERQRNRRLYRDADSAVIGGVCAGLASYFNMDNVLMRILFIILTLVGGGVPILIYIVLWIAVPKALTAAQKLEMRGEKITVSNIERTVRTEYESVKENLKRATDSEEYRQTENFFVKVLKVLGAIILGLFKIFAAIIALVMIFAGLAILVGAAAILFGAGSASFQIMHGVHLPLNRLVEPFVDPSNVTIFLVAILFLVLIPVIVIIYGLLKAVFRFKSNTRQIGLAALIIWILALVTVVAVTINEGKNYSDSESVSMSQDIKDLPGDTLVVRMNNVLPQGWQNEEHIEFNDDWLFNKEMKSFIGTVKVNIEKSDAGYFTVQVRKSARGQDADYAAETAKLIRYDFAARNDSVILDSYFIPEEQKKWRNQKVHVTILVPEGKAVKLGTNTSEYLFDVDNIQNMWDGEMGGKTWVMTEEGLSLVGVKKKD